MNLVFWALFVKSEYFHFFQLLVTLSINIANLTVPMNRAKSEYWPTKIYEVS